MARVDSTQEVLVGQLVDEAFTLAQAEDFPSAIANLEAACKSESARGSTYEMLAQFFLEGDRPQDALQAAQKAVDLDDQWPEAHLTLARADMACWNLQEALQSFHSCMELLGKPDQALKLSDVQAEAAECEAILQHTWEQRIGLQPLRIHQDIGGKSGPGCVVWESGLALAEYLCQHHEAGKVRGREVLELGAGTGIAGISAALLGADVTLTDTAGCIPLLTQNVDRHDRAISEAGGKAKVCVLEWSKDGNVCLDTFKGYQMILGADLVYSRQGVAQLLATLKSLMKTSPDMRLLLGHCSRHSFIDELLSAGLEAIGLAVAVVAISDRDARVSIYRHLPQL